ncbi:prenyltransferase/squalene oxidase repeat-containing protein [Streptomyces sp. NPDC006654]|uniref:prenyltransferase/squalene oxidase repeat-containing protein n=1 Tax=Streptomyces sp. NPDC006654 TaxID=3156897 RepID=UPI0033D3901F
MNATSVSAVSNVSGLESSVSAAVQGLFAHQGETGAFSPTHTRYSPAHSALALIALYLASPDDADGLIIRGITQLCRTQRFDGGWSSHRYGSEPLATALAFDALRLIAPERAAPHIAAAGALIDRIGHSQEAFGEASAGSHERFLFTPTAELQREAPRLPLRPARARRRLSWQLPAVASLNLRGGPHNSPGFPVSRVVGARTRAAALNLIRRLYEHEGATGGFAADPMMTSHICIGLHHSGLGSDIVRASTGWLKAAGNKTGEWSQAPLHVRWTSLACSALADTGRSSDSKLAAAAAMLRQTQHQVPFPTLGVPAGGWSASGGPGWATALDTAEAVSALSKLTVADCSSEVREGAGWLRTQQDSAGSWSYAVRDTVPGAYGPCAHLTAKAVCALLDAGASAADKSIKKAVRWLTGRQDPSGYFTAMWYRGHTIATATVIEAYCRAAGRRNKVVVDACEWLLRTQREDGSWSAGQSVGVSTVEETASAVRALRIAGVSSFASPVLRGAEWLMARQRTNGMWPGEPVNEHVRFQHRYTDDLTATAFALRALVALRGA